MKAYLGLDVGGTKVAAGVVTNAGEVLSTMREDTIACRSGGDPLREIIRLGRAALAQADGAALEGVGIALPGPVTRDGITMRAAPTIPEFQEVALKKPLTAAFGVPVAGDNDANACALAEARFGAGRGGRLVAYITISTGIGGGIVGEGRVLRGATGAAGEFGHQVLLPAGGPLCDCGNTGCLEALASGRGIARRAALAFAAEPATGGPGSGMWTAERAAQYARLGDVRAREVWNETALYLGLGISNIINLFDPDIVVLGGGVAVGAADLLLDPIRDVVRTRCMPSLVRKVDLRIAGLGAHTGVVGAACLAMEIQRPQVHPRLPDPLNP